MDRTCSRYEAVLLIKNLIQNWLKSLEDFLLTSKSIGLGASSFFFLSVYTGFVGVLPKEYSLSFQHVGKLLVNSHYVCRTENAYQKTPDVHGLLCPVDQLMNTVHKDSYKLYTTAPQMLLMFIPWPLLLMALCMLASPAPHMLIRHSSNFSSREMKVETADVKWHWHRAVLRHWSLQRRQWHSNEIYVALHQCPGVYSANGTGRNWNWRMLFS